MKGNVRLNSRDHIWARAIFIQSLQQFDAMLNLILLDTH